MEKVIGSFFIFLLVAVFYAVVKMPDHSMVTPKPSPRVPPRPHAGDSDGPDVPSMAKK
jgi:hypothetical protein